MIIAKEIDGVMWVTAADHQAEVSRLQAESATLSNALAQCRDAVNPHDEKDGWDISMGVPAAVPDLIKRRFDALQGQVAAADRLRDIAHEYWLSSKCENGNIEDCLVETIATYNASKGEA